MKIRIALLFLLIQLSVFAQRNVRDSAIATPWIALHYGLNQTSGDLAEKFGAVNHLGAMAGYKTAKNWVFGMDGNFIFGNKVNISGLFSSLTDSYGKITAQGGEPAVVTVFCRGFNANFMLGKVFPVLSPNENSGIYAHIGAGYLQHRVRIETSEQVVPSIELDYKKGYDRFTSGINLHQFLGYAFMANQGFINFYGGFYLQEGFTKNRREVFFDQPDIPVSTKTMLDIQYGFKIGWFIPVYTRKAKDYYFD